MGESRPDYEFFDELTDRRLIRDALAKLDPVLIAIVCIVVFCDSIALGTTGIVSAIAYDKFKYLGYANGPPARPEKVQTPLELGDESSGE